MELNDRTQEMERVNAGAPLAPIDPALLEYIWEVSSSIDKRENTPAGGVGIGIPEAMTPRSADQHVAMIFRNTMLTALIERGILDEYMQDESRRKQVFAAAASMPCDKNDVSEALVYELFRASPPEVAREKEREMREAGYDFDRPEVREKIIAWMREHPMGHE
jgi:hypothetical protein